MKSNQNSNPVTGENSPLEGTYRRYNSMLVETHEGALLPFSDESVSWRVGFDHTYIPYLKSEDVIRRLIELDPNYEWEAQMPQYMEVAKSSGMEGVFVVTGTLTINGVSRSGVGSDTTSRIGAEAAKSAETAALKRAASKFGIGLGVHDYAQKPDWVLAKEGGRGASGGGYQPRPQQYQSGATRQTGNSGNAGSVRAASQAQINLIETMLKRNNISWGEVYQDLNMPQEISELTIKQASEAITALKEAYGVN